MPTPSASPSPPIAFPSSARASAPTPARASPPRSSSLRSNTTPSFPSPTSPRSLFSWIDPAGPLRHRQSRASLSRLQRSSRRAHPPHPAEARLPATNAKYREYRIEPSSHSSPRMEPRARRPGHILLAHPLRRAYHRVRGRHTLSAQTEYWPPCQPPPHRPRTRATRPAPFHMPRIAVNYRRHRLSFVPAGAARAESAVSLLFRTSHESFWFVGPP